MHDVRANNAHMYYHIIKCGIENHIGGQSCLNSQFTQFTQFQKHRCGAERTDMMLGRRFDRRHERHLKRPSTLCTTASNSTDHHITRVRRLRSTTIMMMMIMMMFSAICSRTDGLMMAAVRSHVYYMHTKAKAPAQNRYKWASRREPSGGPRALLAAAHAHTHRSIAYMEASLDVVVTAAPTRGHNHARSENQQCV